MKEFNTTAVCIPSKHYMVDLTERIREIRKLVDDGKYFTINRARQYGKTTTLSVLSDALQNQYVVISTSFEGIGDAGFADEPSFVKEFCRLLRREFRRNQRVPVEVKESIDGLIAALQHVRNVYYPTKKENQTPILLFHRGRYTGKDFVLHCLSEFVLFALQTFL